MKKEERDRLIIGILMLMGGINSGCLVYLVPDWFFKSAFAISCAFFTFLGFMFISFLFADKDIIKQRR